MQTRRLGPYQVGAIGLGGAGYSVVNIPPETDSIRAVQAALDAGMRLLDTATCYVPGHQLQGHGEALLTEAVRTWAGDASNVVIASKAGIKRIATIPFDVDFAGNFESSGRPEAIRAHAEQSLRHLDVERISLYQLHSPDPSVPLAETMGEFARLQAEGKVELIGVCNVDAARLEEALRGARIDSVQNRLNPADRRSLPVVQRCAELRIAFLAYSPLDGLGRGAAGLAAKLPAFVRLAERLEVSVHRLALAWSLAQGDHVIPIPGCRRVSSVLDCAAAADLELTAEDLAALDEDAAVPA